MAVALAEQLATPGPWGELSFEDRLGLLVDREADARDSRRLATRLKAAKLRYPAAVEDIDFRSPRGLNRAAVLDLAGAGWVTRNHNVVVTGATGVGKSFLACVLANAALRQGHTALYVRTLRLLEELALGRADGRYVRVLSSLGRVSLLVLDDFLLTPAPVEACRDLLEVIEDRAQRRSTLVASQLPVEKVARGHGRSHPGRGRARPRPAGGTPHHRQGPVHAQAPAPGRHVMAAEPQRPDGWLVTYVVEVVFDTNASRTRYDLVGTVARCTGCDERLDAASSPAALLRHARRHEPPALPMAPTVEPGHAETRIPMIDNPPSLVSDGRR